ncbi:SURF1 family protein [Flexivirga caeni]|uniref:SURF1-like protein n=2 Tax=Flexivirga caeni TaxID=2294115 RepID=A0A3M9M9H4_9MICO|nr:SURF1 family protein [Flexivirga caeni]
MLGLLALTVAFFIGCVIAGLWQWGVAQDNGSKAMTDSIHRPVVSLNQELKPQQTFPSDGSLQPVRFQGHYDPSGQVLVSGRVLHGVTGFWVVTPVVVDGTGARIPVVRGFVPRPADATRPPATPVTVTGALAPGEAPSANNPPPGQLSTVDLAALLTKWGGNIYNGFVFLTAEQPVLTSPGVQPFPPPTPGSSGLSLVNLGYALQWWSFAVFAIFIYFRELRREAHPELRPGAAEADNQAGSAPAIPTTEGSHV